MDNADFGIENGGGGEKVLQHCWMVTELVTLFLVGPIPDATIKSAHKSKAAAVLNAARRKILKRLQMIQLERKEREEEGAIDSRNSLSGASDVGQLSLRVSHSGCEFSVDDRVGGNIEKLERGSGEEFGGFFKNDTNENDVFVIEERGFGEMCRKMEVDFGV